MLRCIRHKRGNYATILRRKTPQGFWCTRGHIWPYKKRTKFGKVETVCAGIQIFLTINNCLVRLRTFIKIWNTQEFHTGEHERVSRDVAGSRLTAQPRHEQIVLLGNLKRLPSNINPQVCPILQIDTSGLLYTQVVRPVLLTRET